MHAFQLDQLCGVRSRICGIHVLQERQRSVHLRLRRENGRFIRRRCGLINPCSSENELPRRCRPARARLWFPDSSPPEWPTSQHKPLWRKRKQLETAAHICSRVNRAAVQKDKKKRANISTWEECACWCYGTVTKLLQSKEIKSRPGSGSAFKLVVTKFEGKSPTPLWFSPFHQFGSLQKTKTHKRNADQFKRPSRLNLCMLNTENNPSGVWRSYKTPSGSKTLLTPV